MNIRKSIAVISVMSVLVCSASGCRLLRGKDKAAITDVVSEYIENVAKGKFNKSKKLVEDEEDYFLDNEMDTVQAMLVSAVLQVSEYEVEEINFEGKNATAQVTMSLPDLEEIADEGYTIEEFVEHIEDIEGFVDETVEFGFIKSGDDWLIEADSTEDFYEFCLSIGEGIEFGGLTEGSAIRTVDAFVDYLSEGDLESALDMFSSDDDFMDLIQSFVEFDTFPSLNQLVATYFTRFDYESEAEVNSDDTVTVTITGPAPDLEQAENEALNDPAQMASIYAFYLNDSMGGNDNPFALFDSMLELLKDKVEQADLVSTTWEFVVTEGEDGRLYVYSLDIPGLNIASTDGIGRDELLNMALDILLGQGRIDQNQYDEMIDDEENTGWLTAVPEIIETGDDYSSDATESSEGNIVFVVYTVGNYDEGTSFNYVISYDDNGSEISSTETFVAPWDDCRFVSVDLPETENGFADQYDLIVYDAGSDTDVLGHFILHVVELNN